MSHAIFTRPTYFQLAHAQTNFPAVTLRCVRIFPGVNSRAELVTLAPGLRPKRRFAPLARGKCEAQTERFISDKARLQVLKMA